VQRLGRGLARAGYLVVQPEPPGLGDGSVTCDTLEATVAAARAAADLTETRGGRVALLGASMGAGLVLLAAARPDLADRVSVVAAVAPFADIEKLVCLGTTCHYEEDGHLVRYPVSDLHRGVVARSLAGALPAGGERDRLLAELGLELAEVDLARLERRVDVVREETQAVIRLLANADPQRFRELYAALPREMRAGLLALSPLACCGGLRAPVELVVPPSDQYFPLGEVTALAHALPTGRLTVSGALDHTRPRLSLHRLAEFRRFDAFVVRSLAAASSP
jgi:pimeloyl-ACP methyl ester carboxylesterase